LASFETSPDVLRYYERFAEESRLADGPFRLEFERTREILERVLPRPPATILDVGGAAGTYSAWLAVRGYDVHLVDATARLVDEARNVSATLKNPIASLSVADARSLLRAAGFDNVEVLGVEGPGWLVGDFEMRWDDPALRDDIIAMARALEAEPSIVGASAHLLGIGRKSRP
jgi:hypothetical protein